jgi:FSR family fosmidomycin resistance protein-like MFS transporter
MLAAIPEASMKATTHRVSDTPASNTAYTILAAISVCHLLNDMMQSLLAAIYPIL